MDAMGWLWLDEVEVLNDGRLLANLECQIGNVSFTAYEDPCPIASDDPYNGWTDLDYSSTATAPWYDSGVTYSTEFLGFHVNEMVFNSPIERKVHERGLVRGGANIGRLHRKHMEIAFDITLVATGDTGLRYGFDWLSKQLAGPADCETMTGLVRFSCPETTGERTTDLWEIRNFAVLDGPEWGESPFKLAGCVARTVTFTMVAGDPCRYSTDSTTEVNAATNAVNTAGECGTASTQIDYFCPTNGLPTERESVEAEGHPIGEMTYDILIEDGGEGSAGVLIEASWDPYVSYLDALAGGSGEYASATSPFNLNTASSRVRIIGYQVANDWSPGSLVGVGGFSSGASGWDCVGYVNTSGQPVIQIRESGGTVRTGTSTVALGITDGDGQWLLYDVDVVAGTVSFYSSDDPISTTPTDVVWKTVDLDVTVTSWNKSFASETGLLWGARAVDASTWNGEIYKFYVELDDADVCCNVDLTSGTEGATSWTDIAGVAWTATGTGVEVSARAALHTEGAGDVFARAVTCRIGENEKLWIDSANQRVWYDPGTGSWQDGLDKLALVGQDLPYFFSFSGLGPAGNSQGWLTLEPSRLLGHSSLTEWTVTSALRVCQ